MLGRSKSREFHLKLSGRNLALLAALAVALTAVVACSILFNWGLISQLLLGVMSVLGLCVPFIIELAKREGEADSSNFEQMTRTFGVKLREQWEREFHTRRIDDNVYVSWERASDDLIEAPFESRGRAEVTKELKHASADLAGMLRREPGRRLVVLGDTGSGKTALLIQLLLDLLRSPQQSDPVPVFLSLSSWNPALETLESWLLSQFKVNYPALSSPLGSDSGQTIAEKMVRTHRLLLILDGLDEIPKESRPAAITGINDFPFGDAGIVVSCRTKDYHDAVNYEIGGQDLRVQLDNAVGISLRPLSLDVIRKFILKSAGSQHHVPSRWAPVIDSLDKDPIGSALQTPLMVGLACAIYNPQPGEVSRHDALPEPKELCDLKTPAAVEFHLLSLFVGASYRRRKDLKANRWNAQDAEKWLVFLAHHLRQRCEGRSNLAWWELSYSLPMPEWLPALFVGILCALTSGTVAAFGRHVGRGIGIGLGLGLLVGAGIAVLIRWLSHFENNRDGDNPGEEATGPAKGIAGGMIGAVIGGLAAGLAGKFGIGNALWPFGGLTVALGVGLGVGSITTFPGGLLGGLVGGFLSGFVERVGVGLPAGVINGIGVGLCAGLVVKFMGRSGPAARVKWKYQGAVAGLAIGTGVGLVTGRVEGARIGLVLGVAIGIAAAWPCGLTATIAELSGGSSPGRALTRDYRTFWEAGLSAGFAAGVAGLVGGSLVAVLASKSSADFHNILADGLGIGLAAGIVVGLSFAFYHAASGPFLITRLWFALRGRLPWRLMAFLADAHDTRGVLRQSGVYYQFRHDRLQKWLADEGDDSPLPDASPPTGPTLAPTARPRP
jgi:hypothetical protein